MRKAIAFYLVSYVFVTLAFAQSDVQNLTTEQWHEDIATLVERLESMHPNPYAHISKQAFDAQLEAIRNELPALEHGEILVKLMQLVALLQDGHTNLIPTGPNGFDSWFPVRFYRFSDGLFITAIDKSQSELVAGQVLRIGNRSAEDAHKLAASLVGTDNEMGKREAVWYLSSPAALTALNVNDSLARLPLRVKTRQGEVRDVELEAGTAKFDLEWRFWGEMFGPPGMDSVTAFAGKAPADFLNPEANPDLPLHLRGRRAFWFTFLDDKKAVYMQLNSVTNQSRYTHETFEQMYLRMFDFSCVPAQKSLTFAKRYVSHFQPPDMIYLRGVARKSMELPEQFPFTLPIIQNLDEVTFTSQVTFFVGENGTGKSTLLEGIAAAARAIAIGSQDIDRDETLAFARSFANHFRLSFSRRPHRGFFFRAEDIFGFTRRVSKTAGELEEMEKDFSETLTGLGRQLAMGAARGQRMAFQGRYGENPDARSHGESFLHLFESRMVPEGLYILDEPETPLSPLRQLTFISLMKEMVEHSCQFLIATHSPILMAFPDSTILNFDGEKLAEIDYGNVEHVSLTRAFLNDPESFIRRL